MGNYEPDDILGPDEGLPVPADRQKKDASGFSHDGYIPNELPPVSEVVQFVRQVSELSQGMPKQVSLDEVLRLANKGSILIRACNKQFASGQKHDPLNNLRSDGQTAEVLTQSLRLLVTRLARIYREPSERVIAKFHERTRQHADSLGDDPFFSSRSYVDQIKNATTIARWELKFDAGLRPFERPKEKSEGFWTPSGDYFSAAGTAEWDRLKAKVSIPDRPGGIYGTLRLDLSKSGKRIVLNDILDDLCRWVSKELNFAHDQQTDSATSLMASEARQKKLANSYRLYDINLPNAVKRVANILEKNARFDLVDENVAETLRRVLHPSQFIRYGR